MVWTENPPQGDIFILFSAAIRLLSSPPSLPVAADSAALTWPGPFIFLPIPSPFLLLDVYPAQPQPPGAICVSLLMLDDVNYPVP